MSTELVERLRHGVPLTEVDGREVADTDAADATMEWAANVILSLTAQRDNFREKALAKMRMADRLAVIEECAKVADSVAKVIKVNGWPQYAAQQCATAIRALSEPDKEGML